MKLTPVKTLPDPDFRSKYKNNAGLCREFLNMNVKYARVDFDSDEYRSIHSAYGSLRSFLKQHDYPIYVAIMDGHLYFIRTTKEES